MPVSDLLFLLLCCLVTYIEPLVVQKLVIPLLSQSVSDKALQAILSAVGTLGFLVSFEAFHPALLANDTCGASDAHEYFFNDQF